MTSPRPRSLEIAPRTSLSAAGRGPRAWTNHWLLVPLIERDGSRSGFIWVGRSVRLAAARPRAAAGAADVREPGNDGAPRGGRLRDAQRAQHRAGGAARARRSPCSSGTTSTACSTAILSNAALARRRTARLPRPRRTTRPSELRAPRVSSASRTDLPLPLIARGEGRRRRRSGRRAARCRRRLRILGRPVAATSQTLRSHAVLGCAAATSAARSSASSGSRTTSQGRTFEPGAARLARAVRATSPRSRSRTRDCTRRCSRARSSTARSSTARQT